MPDESNTPEDAVRPELSSLARGLSASYGRITRAVRALGFSPDEFILLVAIVEVPEPWSAKALSEYTGIPKTTVLRKLRRGRQRGYLRQDASGWSFQPDQLERTFGFIGETAMIAKGEQTGFSADIIATFQDDQDGSATCAQSIGFSPLKL